uniref:Uncharacterized protein n=1 Tax=Leersia perrieri TaxID=77586 RepID=A0A0D9X9Z1_9ORYZ
MVEGLILFRVSLRSCDDIPHWIVNGGSDYFIYRIDTPLLSESATPHRDPKLEITRKQVQQDDVPNED